MAMNIKNDKAERLAKQVAALTGESYTEAITVALEERLVRLQENNNLLERWMTRLEASDKELTEEIRNMNMNDFLYDESGLPK